MSRKRASRAATSRAGWACSMARLTAAERNSLPDSAFAGPGRTYPVEDASHARNALARVSEFAPLAEKAKVRAKVGKKYPTIAIAKAISKGSHGRD